MLKLHGLRTHCSRVSKQSDAWSLRGSLLRARFFKGKSASQIMDKFRTIMGKFRTTSRFLRFHTSVKLLMTPSIRGFRVSYSSLVLMARFIVWFVYLQRSLLLKYSLSSDEIQCVFWRPERCNAENLGLLQHG